jgi:hypothetical protein
MFDDGAGFDFIDILAAGAGSPAGGPFQVRVADLDAAACWLRKNRNGDGRGVNAAVAFGEAERVASGGLRFRHIGEAASVCGVVASGRYSEPTRGSPTFLDIDGAYPRQLFSIVIWGNNRSKFGAPKQQLRNKRVCVTLSGNSKPQQFAQSYY